MNYELGKWGGGEVGNYELWIGEMGRWGDHFVRVAGGSGEIELKPQNPITPKPYHPKTLSPCLLTPNSF